MNWCVLAIPLALAAAMPGRTSAAALTPGNVLFADRDTIREFTLAGQQLQAVYVPPGDGVVQGREFARNMVIDERGFVHVYNGTFRPTISTWDPISGDWTHLNVPGLATVGYVAGGGICASKNYLYATDVGNSVSPDQGLVRISLTDGTITRFATDHGYDDVDIGPGGLVYGLDHAQVQVRKFDPISLAQVGVIILPAFCTSIVVTPTGDLFGASYAGGGLRHIGPDGSLLGVVGTGNCGMTSIDRLENGVVVATGFCGRVFVTDERLRTPDQFTADRYGGSVAAIPLALGNRPPDCSHAAANPAQIWPPNHRLVPVVITGVTDPDGDPVTITVTGITQDEPLNQLGQGNTCPDAMVADGAAQVRAERTGTDNGRVYTISFTASDDRSGSCNGSVTVCVPHDQSDDSLDLSQGGDPVSAPRPSRFADDPCEDDGQLFSSLGTCPPPRHIRSDAVTKVTLTASPRSGNTATIAYSLPAASDLMIAVYDIAGRRVATLLNGSQDAGVHQLRWNAGSLALGIYFYRLQVGSVTVTKPMLVLK